MPALQAYEARSTEGTNAVMTAGRPLRVNKHTGEVQIQSSRGFVTNSLLKREEWKELDALVIEAALKPLVIVEDLKSRGLVKTHGSIGVLSSEWGMSSEMSEAEASMTGRSRSDRDRIEYSLQSVPIPVISKEFEIGARELEAARLGGTSLSMDNATAAARVVSEYLENMALNGSGEIVWGGKSIYGIINYTDAITDTSANFGGGDWATAENPEKTIAGMIAALQNTNQHYGPYVAYVPTTQYNEAALAWLSTDTDTRSLDRIMALEPVEAVRHAPFMTAGTVALVQIDRDVVEWGQTWDTRVVEVVSPLLMSTTFRVIAIQTMRCKSRYDGKSGIAIATGC